MAQIEQMPAKGTKEERKLFTKVIRHYEMAKEDLENRIADWNVKDELFRSYIDEKDWPYQSVVFDPRVFTAIFEKTAQFLSKTKLDVRIVYHSHTLASEMTPVLQEELERIYDLTRVPPVIAYERNNGGVFELERLSLLNRQGKYKIFNMPQYGGIHNNQPAYRDWETDRKSTRLNSSHEIPSRMPSSA